MVSFDRPMGMINCRHDGAAEDPSPRGEHVVQMRSAPLVLCGTAEMRMRPCGEGRRLDIAAFRNTDYSYIIGLFRYRRTVKIAAEKL